MHITGNEKKEKLKCRVYTAGYSGPVCGSLRSRRRWVLKWKLDDGQDLDSLTVGY